MHLVEFHDPITRKEMLSRISRDRDQLLGRLRSLRPDLKSAYPYELLRPAIRTLCRYRIAPRVLMPGQLAVCDFQQKIVYYNSEMKSFVGPKTNIPGLLNSTLAHELGHIRLHHEEMADRCVGSSLQMFNGGFAPMDGRELQRELEADLYAAAFLVPGRLLVNERAAQKLYQWHKNHRSVKSSTIWRKIFALANRFQVSPTLMKRCLHEIGWIRTSEVKTSGKSELEICHVL